MKKKFAASIYKGFREIVLLFIDLVCVTVCYAATFFLANIDTVNSDLIYNAVLALPILFCLIIIFFGVFRLFSSIWRYAGISDYLKLVSALTCACVIFDLIAYFLWPKITDVGFYFFMLVTVCAGLCLMRFIYAFLCNKFNEAKGSGKENTMIIGAGYTAKLILEEMKMHKGKMKPMCVVDDDPDKKGRIIGGVKIAGNTSEITKLAKKYDIKQIIFAIPSCSEENRQRILKNCLASKCEVKVLPFIDEMIYHANLLSQVKEIKIEDLLGRQPVVFDTDEVKKYIKGKVCLVTGGGGSIGSELCRQIARFEPQKLIILDIYENSAYDIQQELLYAYGADLNLDVEIFSVCDYERLRLLFEKERPQIIFHAAAHKHVPLMETNPEEAVKNNVMGTYNTAKLAGMYKAQKFILISTDKAVNPTNVMGATKRCCEMIIQFMSSQYSDCEYAGVRFGNVLGSNGSVIPVFTRQIKAGGPVTVTHKDIIRYFMTIPEAVSLVLQAGCYAHRGEIFVLDMGEPVKIVELAENLIRMMGYIPYETMDIVFTGLRPGEKLYEEVLMDEEGLKNTDNAKIHIGKQIDINLQTFEKRLMKLVDIANTNDRSAVIFALAGLIPTFHHAENNRKTDSKNISAVEVKKMQAEILKAKKRSSK